MRNNRIPQMVLELNTEDRGRKGNLENSGWSKNKHDQERSHKEDAEDIYLRWRKIDLGMPIVMYKIPF